MPSSLAGLVAFVYLLTPGFIFVAGRERRFPSRKLSALRESSAVVTASLLCNGASAALLGLVRLAAPGMAPDIGELLNSGRTYFNNEYVLVSAWGVSFLAISSVIAYVLGSPPSTILSMVSRVTDLPRIESRVPAAVSSWMADQKRPPIARVSGWTRAFQFYADSHVWVGCDLVDGRHVAGWLLSASPQTEETDERSIVLSGGVRMRVAGAPNDEFENVGAGVVVIPARSIALMTVGYFDSDDSQPY